MRRVRERRPSISGADEIGKLRADCDGRGSEWDDKTTAPVGSFPPNAFGIRDVAGTSGSGSRIASMRTTTARPRTGRLGQARHAARA